MFAALTAALCLAQTPVKVDLVKTASGWELRRNGQKYFVKGAGGSGSFEKLKEMGGNSTRTWGIGPDTQEILDHAQKLGLTVMVGIWLGHKEHGFNYSNADAVKKQLEDARAAIRKYKNHPAVLMWGIGNEEEGDGSDPAVWKAVNDIAAMAKAEDPSHPTCTVVAELGDVKIANFNKYAPAIDVIGINSYGGGASVMNRYKQQGGNRPAIITEFGPLGPWEVARSSWGTPLEGSSTQKAADYETTYRKSVLDHPDMTLGSYAFLWGWKQEGTATWFGMLLPDGCHTAAAETMSRLWTGKTPANRVPVIESAAVKGKDSVAPGASVEVEVSVKDPDGDPLKYEWALKGDSSAANQGGADEAAQKTLDSALVSSSGGRALFKAPEAQGSYRVFLYVRDGKGGAATVNLPILVEDPKRSSHGKKLALPAYVFKSGSSAMPWAPSGFMGQAESLEASATTKEARTPGGSSFMLAFKSASGWGGIAFQNPEGDWGTKDGGYDLTGAKKLAFWAKGEKGGEKVKFEYGILSRTAAYYDTANGSMTVTLDRAWKEYSFSLAGRNLSRIKTGFSWVAAAEGSPIRIYVTDVRYE